MEIRTIDLKEMNPAPYNPRVELKPDDPEYIKLQNSINQFGYVEPIIWNQRTGNIVGGHQRWRVLLDNGTKSVEAVVVDISQHDEKILNVLLNKAQGEWDIPKLQQVMQDIENAGADIDITGFDQWELQGLVDSYDELEDILDYTPPEEETEQDSSFDMTFMIPLEEKPAVDAYMVAYADTANEQLAAAIMDMIEEAGHAD